MVQVILLHQAYLWSRLSYCIRLNYGSGYPTAPGLPVVQATLLHQAYLWSRLSYCTGLTCRYHPWMFTWLLYFLPETAL